MKLLVGLGNPGNRYLLTRHNVGFMMLDLLAQQAGVLATKEQFKAQVSKGEYLGQSALFLKPMTYMNLSGHAVSQALAFYKVAPADMVVIHDDLDLPWGTVKVRMGGGHGGHNGIRHILEQLGHGDFARIKVGIGRPSEGRHEISDWVLSPLSQIELAELRDQVFPTVCERLKTLY